MQPEKEYDWLVAKDAAASHFPFAVAIQYLGSKINRKS
jgi:hypothetical protein